MKCEHEIFKHSPDEKCNICPDETEESDLPSARGYAPFKPPFRYDPDGQCIFDHNGNMIVDVRGWGFLTGKGAMAYDKEKAINIQDRIGRHIAHIMTEDAGA